MKITFLGTGTSQGVPIIACDCIVCTSLNEKDKRYRSSILIEANDHAFVIDTGPDFRSQMLRNKSKRLDAVIFTHEHKDHIAGFDDIRAFNYIQGTAIDVYATSHVQAAIRREFPYIFDEFKYPGIPQITLHTIDPTRPFQIKGSTFMPIQLLHYKLPVLGYRVGDFVYITDANYINEVEKEKIKGAKILVLNALRKEQHISHFTLDQAIALSKELAVEQTYFTHISHQLGLHHQIEQDLPINMQLAYDELVLTL